MAGLISKEVGVVRRLRRAVMEGRHNISVGRQTEEIRRGGREANLRRAEGEESERMTCSRRTERL